MRFYSHPVFTFLPPIRYSEYPLAHHRRRWLQAGLRKKRELALLTCVNIRSSAIDITTCHAMSYSLGIGSFANRTRINWLLSIIFWKLFRWDMRLQRPLRRVSWYFAGNSRKQKSNKSIHEFCAAQLQAKRFGLRIHSFMISRLLFISQKKTPASLLLISPGIAYNR